MAVPRQCKVRRLANWSLLVNKQNRHCGTIPRPRLADSPNRYAVPTYQPTYLPGGCCWVGPSRGEAYCEPSSRCVGSR